MFFQKNYFIQNWSGIKTTSCAHTKKYIFKIKLWPYNFHQILPNNTIMPCLTNIIKHRLQVWPWLDGEPLQRVLPDELGAGIRLGRARDLLHGVAPHVGQEGDHGLGVVTRVQRGDGVHRQLVQVAAGPEGQLKGALLLELQTINLWCFHNHGEGPY